MLMISILTEWLKEIIVVVLLAVFLDLILPNSQLQRYVKMVMGLLILMTMLSPVLRFLNHDFSLRMLSDYGLESQAGVAGWEEVQRERDKLVEMQEQQSGKYLEEQIAARIKQQVEQQFGTAVKEVGVHTMPLRGSPSSNPPVISSIEIVLHTSSAEAATGETGTGQPSPIDPIQPVSIVGIHIPEITTDNNIRDNQPALPPQSSADSSQDGLLADIVTHIANTWDLDTGSVTVRYHAG